MHHVAGGFERFVTFFFSEYPLDFSVQRIALGFHVRLGLGAAHAVHVGAGMVNQGLAKLRADGAGQQFTRWDHQIAAGFDLLKLHSDAWHSLSQCVQVHTSGHQSRCIKVDIGRTFIRQALQVGVERIRAARYQLACFSGFL